MNPVTSGKLTEDEANIGRRNNVRSELPVTHFSFIVRPAAVSTTFLILNLGVSKVQFLKVASLLCVLSKKNGGG